MKKRILICAFVLLILLTAIFIVVTAIKSYNYKVDKHERLFSGLGAVIGGIVGGGFVVFYELDLFHTVYYFLFRPKTTAKSLLNILANLCLIIVFVFTLLSNKNIALSEYKFVLLLLMVAYIVLKAVYFIISIISFRYIKQNADDSLSRQKPASVQ